MVAFSRYLVETVVVFTLVVVFCFPQFSLAHSFTAQCYALNDLTGYLIKDLKPLSQLTDLERLTIKNHGITSITPLMSLGNLRYLDISGNPQLENIEAVRYMENLTEFSYHCLVANAENDGLKRCKTDVLKDIGPLSHLNWLEEVMISQIHHLDLTPLANLKNITQLTVTNSEVSELRPVANMKKLTRINLSSNQIKDISPLGNLPALARLILTKGPHKNNFPFSNNDPSTLTAALILAICRILLVFVYC